MDRQQNSRKVGKQEVKDHKEAVNNIMENIKNEMLWRLESEYQRGYEDGKKNHEKVRNDDMGYGYQRGLEDAWECARKIACIRTDAEWKEFFEFLDVELFHPEDIFTKYTASEAMQKIKDYEEWQNEEIKVGDEVKVCDCIGIVTRHAPKTRTCYVMYRDGSCGEEELTDCEKTGNHSMSLDKWLEQMRKESHEV